jgi:predicted permease
VLRDIRYALRSCRLNPGITSVAVFSLAIGMGGATAVFGLIDAVVLKPLPVSKPDRLVTATLVLPHGVFDSFSQAQFEAFRSAPVFSSACAWYTNRLEVEWAGQNESVLGQSVTPGYFQTLGIVPAIGSFQAGNVAISYPFWKRRFNGSLAVLGQRVNIQGTPFTISAVTPRGFFGTEIGSLPDLFVPLAPRQSDMPWLKFVGRLSSTAGMEQASVQLNAILQRQLMDVIQAAPAGTPDRLKREFLQQRIEIVRAGAFSPARRAFTGPLAILMALVGLVLLIACGNVANLLLSRAFTRRKEIGIRLASGASRARLIRQLMVESLVLSAIGGAAGAILAQWLERLLVAIFNTGQAAIGLNTSIDARFFGFTAAVVVLSGLLFGIVPALRAVGSVKPGASAGKALVALQVAMSMCLLVGAGLFVRTLMNLENVNTGFNRHRVVLVRMHPARAGDYSQLLDAVRGIPGVQSASLSRFTPMEGSDLSDPVGIEGYAPRPGESLRVKINFVLPRFFQTLGTPVPMGRDFNPGDAGRNVAIVNQSFAKRYFADRNPIGRQFQLAGRNGAAYEIVGVAGDTKYRNLREPVPPTVFYSALQNPSRLGAPQLSVRVADGMKISAETIRRTVSRLGIPADDATTLDEQIDATLLQERVMANLSGALGLVALVLTCIGLYGVISYTTARRTKEIGIRMALGADSSAVVWPVVRQTMMIAASGIPVGLCAAVGAVRWIKVGLFGVTALDPVTIVSSAALLMAVATAAAYIPARRAALVNPLIALRHE